MRTLEDWLSFIERQHAHSIALGLERVAEVFTRMQIRSQCPIITVGGTNGKGSTCAMLESILRGGAPHGALHLAPPCSLQRARTHRRRRSRRCGARGRFRSGGARGDTPLTYFEYGTLAALWLFRDVEIAVLEVGLGGRLDAVNVLDASCAVLTSVDIDHVDYLGPDRESIGREKAGIFREGRPAVIAEPKLPRAVLEAPGTKLLFGRDFGFSAASNQWSYWGSAGKRAGLAYPALRGNLQIRNAAAALCALDALEFPITMQDVRRGLAEVTLPARFQVVPGRPQVILDVAHNVEAARTRREPGGVGIRTGDDRGVRHAARQGHGRRARCACRA